MGASTFTHYDQHPDLKHAFTLAHEQAAHEHGHGGYTGTLAEKYDVTVIDSTPVPLAAAYERADQLIKAAAHDLPTLLDVAAACRDALAHPDAGVPDDEVERLRDRVQATERELFSIAEGAHRLAEMADETIAKVAEFPAIGARTVSGEGDRG